MGGSPIPPQGRIGNAVWPTPTNLLLHLAHRFGDDGQEAGGAVVQGAVHFMRQGEELVVTLPDESRSVFHAERVGLALSLDLHQANVARLGTSQPGHTPASV